MNHFAATGAPTASSSANTSYNTSYNTNADSHHNASNQSRGSSRHHQSASSAAARQTHKNSQNTKNNTPKNNAVASQVAVVAKSASAYQRGRRDDDAVNDDDDAKNNNYRGAAHRSNPYSSASRKKETHTAASSSCSSSAAEETSYASSSLAVVMAGEGSGAAATSTSAAAVTSLREDVRSIVASAMHSLESLRRTRDEIMKRGEGGSLAAAGDVRTPPLFPPHHSSRDEGGDTKERRQAKTAHHRGSSRGERTASSPPSSLSSPLSPLRNGKASSSSPAVLKDVIASPKPSSSPRQHRDATDQRRGGRNESGRRGEKGDVKDEQRERKGARHHRQRPSGMKDDDNDDDVDDVSLSADHLSTHGRKSAPIFTVRTTRDGAGRHHRDTNVVPEVMTAKGRRRRRSSLGDDTDADSLESTTTTTDNPSEESPRRQHPRRRGHGHARDGRHVYTSAFGQRFANSRLELSARDGKPSKINTHNHQLRKRNTSSSSSSSSSHSHRDGTRRSGASLKPQRGGGRRRRGSSGEKYSYRTRAQYHRGDEDDEDEDEGPSAVEEADASDATSDDTRLPCAPYDHHRRHHRHQAHSDENSATSSSRSSSVSSSLRDEDACNEERRERRSFVRNERGQESGTVARVNKNNMNTINHKKVTRKTTNPPNTAASARHFGAADENASDGRSRKAEAKGRGQSNVPPSHSNAAPDGGDDTVEDGADDDAAAATRLLRSQVSKLTEELSQLKIVHTQSQLDYETAIAGLRVAHQKELTTLVSDLTAAKHKGIEETSKAVRSQFEEELEKARNDLAASKKECTDVNRRFQQFKQNYTQQKERIASLEEHVAQRDKKLEACLRRVEEAQRAARDCAAQRQALETQLSNKQHEVEIEIQRRSACEAQLSSLALQLKAAEDGTRDFEEQATAELKRLSLLFEDSKASYEGRLTEALAKAEMCEKARKKIKALKVQCGADAETILALREDLVCATAAAEESAVARAEEVAALQSECDTLRQSLQLEREGYQSFLKQTDATLATVHQEYSEKFHLVKNQCERLDAALQHCRGELESEKQERQASDRAVSELSLQLESCAEKQRLAEVLAREKFEAYRQHTNETISSLKKQIADRDRRTEQLAAMTSGNGDVIGRLRDQLAAERAKSAGLEAQMREVKGLARRVGDNLQREVRRSEIRNTTNISTNQLTSSSYPPTYDATSAVFTTANTMATPSPHPLTIGSSSSHGQPVESLSNCSDNKNPSLSLSTASAPPPSYVRPPTRATDDDLEALGSGGSVGLVASAARAVLQLQGGEGEGKQDAETDGRNVASMTPITAQKRAEGSGGEANNGMRTAIVDADEGSRANQLGCDNKKGSGKESGVGSSAVASLSRFREQSNGLSQRLAAPSSQLDATTTMAITPIPSGGRGNTSSLLSAADVAFQRQCVDRVRGIAYADGTTTSSSSSEETDSD